MTIIQAHVFAESTKKTYASYLAVFKKFCYENSITMVPISPQDLGRYIAFLSLKYKYSSMINYLSVVRLVHLENGFPNPLDSHFATNLKKGTRRLLGDQVSRKLPITPSVLMAIFSQLVFTNSLHVSFWAACTVAFFSFFRKSNLLPESPKGSKHPYLTRGDISFSAQGAVVSVQWSKTIQYKQRSLVVPLPLIANSPLCPSSSLHMSIKSVPGAAPASSPFLYREGGSQKVLTYSKFHKFLMTCLNRLHLDSKSYSGHSFRRGGATFALECGVPSELIKTQGDWRSSAYQLYLDPSFQARQKVSSYMSQAILNMFPV